MKLIKVNGEPLHIIVENKEDIAPIILLPGDPLRAKYIAKNFLTDAKLVNTLRNMFAYTGFYNGIKVTVMGSGMGMPSMGIYAYELFNFFHVKKIIRIGTCGAVKEGIKVPQVVMVDNVYTESNFAYLFNEEKINLVKGSIKLNQDIMATAKDLNISVIKGDNVTMDVFGPYVAIDNIIGRTPKFLDIVTEEMECFALFYIAKCFEREASCLLTTVDSNFSEDVVSPEERETALNEMIKLALETIIK